MAKWVCSVCGYVYEGENAPEVCPICKAPAEKFTKQERAANQRSRKLKQEQQAREQQAAIAGFTVKSKSRPTVKKSNVRGMAKTTSTAKNVRNVKSVKTK